MSNQKYPMKSMVEYELIILQGIIWYVLMTCNPFRVKSTRHSTPCANYETSFQIMRKFIKRSMSQNKISPWADTLLISWKTRFDHFTARFSDSNDKNHWCSLITPAYFMPNNPFADRNFWDLLELAMITLHRVIICIVKQLVERFF